jgi:hypothetical protein
VRIHNLSERVVRKALVGDEPAQRRYRKGTGWKARELGDLLPAKQALQMITGMRVFIGYTPSLVAGV